MISKENIASHELIGLHTQIVESSNTHVVGLSGKIIDETKFMFTLNTTNGIKRMAKNFNRWKFEFNGQEVELDGSRLVRRSYERIGVKA